MAVNQYVFGATITIPAGTIESQTMAGSPAGTPTPNSIGFGTEATTAGYDVKPITYSKGQLINLDPTGPVYSALTTAGAVLTQVTRSREGGTSGGIYGTSN